tara:strand:- start:260 stop:784 length:525 start_codon:yes stop_codon:yes gene_type:complete
MNKYVKIFFSTILICLLITPSWAEKSITFIDLNFIFNNSIAGKKINKKIETEIKQINKELSNYNKILKEEETDLTNKKKLLSQEELQSKTISLKNNAKKYNEIILEKRKNLNIYRDKIQKKFYEEITQIIQEYALDNSIDIIIKKQDILIGNKKFDITKEILSFFDKNFKEIKI